jgi:hypothetical protein
MLTGDLNTRMGNRNLDKIIRRFGETIVNDSEIRDY